MILRKILVGTLIAFSLSGCAGSTEPKESEILREIAQRLPAGVDFNTIRHKVFPSEGRSSGRIDFAGSMITAEARVERETMTRRRLYEWAESEGITKSNYVLNRIMKQVCLSLNCNSALYEVRIPSGAIFEFTGELSYIETVDGFRFSGSVDHDLCCAPMSEIRDSVGLAFVYDTTEFQEWYDRILYWYDHDQKVLPATAERLLRSSVDNWKIEDDGGNVLATIKLDNLEPATWTTRTIDQGLRYEVSAPIIMEARSEFSVWYEDIRGANESYNIVMALDYANPKLETSCIRLRRRGHGSDGSGEICWADASWSRIKRPGNGIFDKRSEKNLSIGPGIR